MPEYKFHHIHLMSPDPVKTAEFYQGVFNAELVSTQESPDGNVRVELNLDGTRVMVMKPAEDAPIAAGASPTGLDHIGLITNDLDASIADLKARGVKFRVETFEMAPGVRISFFWGPEDVLIELIEIKFNQ